MVPLARRRIVQAQDQITRRACSCCRVRARGRQDAFATLSMNRSTWSAMVG